MSNARFRNQKADINWLLETHLKDEEDFQWIKDNIESFIIVTNDDGDLEQLELYSTSEIVLGQKSFFIMKGNKYE